MAVIQGGYVRRLPQHKIKSTAVTGLWLIVPSFVLVGLARSLVVLYLGLFLFAACEYLLKNFVELTNQVFFSHCIGCAMLNDDGVICRLPTAKGDCDGNIPISRCIGSCFGANTCQRSILESWIINNILHRCNCTVMASIKP